MAKVFLVILTVPIILFLSIIILWMNITPGYFQSVCCNVRYVSDDLLIFCKPEINECMELNAVDTGKLFLAYLDFNR